MKNEYIIINKTTIEKKINTLKKELEESEPTQFNNEGIENEVRKKRIETFEAVLANSTLLIPEIEKAFDEGQNRMQHEIIEKLGLRYQTEQISQSTILNMEVHSEDYISNLKLDI